ncbi:MAG: hypothetical protein J0H08_08200 [Rhizobiales bacterium]|nr:hypothetical protein [Hyphomicrobiales bacterium]
MNGTTIMWAVTIVFTALAGSVVAYVFQNRSWVFQQQKRIRDEQVASLSKTVERLSAAIFRRIAITEVLLAALKSNDRSRIEKAANDYNSSIVSFNVDIRESLPILVREDYASGSERIATIEKDIVSQLAMIGSRLDNIVIKDITIKSTEISELSSRLRYINHMSFNIIRDIYRDMQN